MSEEIDLEANNLCIPEDAFEKFQAVSMYQEEECIMLPQTQPKSKPPEPNRTMTKSDVNKLVSSSDNNVDSPGSYMEVEYLEEESVNSMTLEPNASLGGETNSIAPADKSLENSKSTAQLLNILGNDSDMVVSNSESVNDRESSVLESPLLDNNKAPRRRGRKPKNSLTSMNESISTPKNIQNPEISSTPFSPDPEHSDKVSAVQKRRGRPRKVSTKYTDTETATIRDRDQSSELSSSDNRAYDSSNDQSGASNGKARRQRQLKVYPNSHSRGGSSVLKHKNDTKTEASKDVDTSYTDETSKRYKRTYARKSVAEKVEQPTTDNPSKSELDNKLSSGGVSESEDLDDVCLSKLKSIPDVSTDDKPSPDLQGEQQSNKKRRGRPKKVVTESLSQAIEKSVFGTELSVDNEEAENISLSRLKTITDGETSSVLDFDNTSKDLNSDVKVSDIPQIQSEINGTTSKRNPKVPVMADFEYNIDSVFENNTNELSGDNSLLVEDTSKRPTRQKTKKQKYEEESDEDPFANVELSDDDEPRRGRKGNKYYSDDEYIPGKRGNAALDSTDTEVSDSEKLEITDDVKKQKRRKPRKKSDTQSPRKRSKKDEATNAANSEKKENLDNSDDVEICLTPSVIKNSDTESQPSQAWGNTTEFENFLAKKIGTSLKIKKVSSSVPSETNKIDIPVIDPEAKRTIEMCTQTNAVATTSKAVQTGTPYDIPMKENVKLTSEQSQKACYFLNSIVKTTAELGSLMTQKSEDFIKKKINTSLVTDTMKMDYCVRKSFLLFKLAKHNLMQMEEDLAKQYDEFLRENNLSKFREQPKQVLPTVKESNSDSDCEIVEVKSVPPSKPSPKSPAKPAFNPKTVFLNKELSIKIAKKPSDNKKLDIKGRHTVWINDTVMVKKVKPTQSFLAQDSRNKKPPDNCITTEMVSNFFKNYYRQKALSVCAPYVTMDWLKVRKEIVCNYFVAKPLQFDTDANYTRNAGFNNSTTESGTSVSEPSRNLNNVMTLVMNTVNSSPEPLFVLCFHVLKKLISHNRVTTLKQVTNKIRHDLTDGKHQPVTLSRLSLNALNDSTVNNIEHTTSSKHEPSTDDIHIPCNSVVSNQVPLPLKLLCHRRLVELLADSPNNNKKHDQKKIVHIEVSSHSSNDFDLTNLELKESWSERTKNGVKSLFILCVEHINKLLASETNNNCEVTPNSLKSIAFNNVRQLLYRDDYETNDNAIVIPKTLQTIALDNVNQLLFTNNTETQLNESEVAVEGLGLINCVNTLSEEAFLNLEQHTDAPNSPDYYDDYDNGDSYEPDQTEPSWVSQVQMEEPRSCVNVQNSEEVTMETSITQIKIEPLDDIIDNTMGMVQVKSEPGPGLDEMTIIPDVKPEFDEDLIPAGIQGHDSNSYDEGTFEQFMSGNKMIQDQVYSQSSERVRMQHEPDYYDENPDMLGLLVPHAYEPLHVQTAKGSLMESSSDESTVNSRHVPRKVGGKRGRGRPKKTEQRTAKDISVLSKEKDRHSEKMTGNEVAVLTKRMKEKIRQEEKKDDSSDSESESLAVHLSRREKKDNSDKAKPVPSSKSKNNEIQCNNVDSTDQIDEDSTFTGFTPTESNEMTNYEKYMKLVYNKVLTEEESKRLEENKSAEGTATADSAIVSTNEPVEQLECEPTLPFFDDDDNVLSKKTKIKVKPVEALGNVSTELPSFTDRHGWHCYPVDSNDPKLYQNASVNLERLPESFVQTYFKYQNITNADKFDKEFNRLTNLNSLNRCTNLKERKRINKRDTKTGVLDHASDDDGQAVNAGDSDHYDELLPSDDEAPRVEDEVPQPVVRQTENKLAKDLLMNDNESDEEAGGRTIKEEPGEENKRTRSSKKIAVKTEPEDPSGLMLTADKMMNKELTLLHAPVVLDDKVQDSTSKGPAAKQSKKSGSKASTSSSKIKTEEDSSSEEEKQWVSTKEKLLKRMGKKESTSADDAKRAKLVSEFIERREGNPNTGSRRGTRPRRSGKKFLEREKQLRVLHRELFGEMSNDPTVSKRSAAAWKGRRNIRKVLDKKSLARSTVIANMEEFERKRRLNARQTKLRELLGCEEGVNVLVINDEVCLEYDFEEHRPVVTIHPFFTKVMKAHQYEGVKFMWDACFESLADIEAGHSGGGCILAHCMGLGKTLQVLALLHTVLTHPRVGMHRVLVCCPLSTVLNWVDEIHKWIGPVTNQIKVFELSKLKKTYERAYQLEDWYNGGGIFIIGYELFRSLSTLDAELDDIRPTIVNKIRTALLDPGPDIVVCDEGHLLKNDCSVLAVAMSRVVTKRRIVLTGTPMQNNLREYYCMVNFVKPNLLGTYAEYSNRFENPIMNGQHRDSREEDIKLMKARTHILHKVLEGCLQRQEASVLYPYLPKKHEYTVFITLTKCQWDLYKHYLNNYSRHMSKTSILKDFHILQKIWSHPQVLHNFQTKAQENRTKQKERERIEDDLATEDQEDIKDVTTELWWLQYLEDGNMLDSLETSNKFVVVFRILDECVALGDKVLIFSTSLFCLDAMEYFLKKINKWSLGQEYYRLDGSVPAEVRQKWCREFNAENNVNTKLFLVSTRAGCLGLNMTAANRVIIMDTSWNPAHDIQSIFRVYRFGQKKDCFIYRLVAMGTMEQKIYERSVTKQAVACRVVDEQQIDRHYNMDELTELYKYDEAGSSVAGGVAVGVRDVALLRVARDVALHAVHEHDSLLRSSEQGLPEHERAAAWRQFQQEQAHEQLENKLFANIPKISLKRLGEKASASSPETSRLPNVKVENADDDFAPPPAPRPKRGRKVKKITIEVPAATPGPSAQNDDDATDPDPAKEIYVEVPGPSGDTSSNTSKQYDEQILVQKISHLLVKHKFQAKDGNHEIASLVRKVRRIVHQGGMLKHDAADELTASIARVLLPLQMSVPAATGIMCESINNSAAPCVAEHDASDTRNDAKPKRKAAIAAEKHIDSIAQDVIINLDDDPDPKDADFVPDVTRERPEKSQSNKRKSNTVDATPLHKEIKSNKKESVTNLTKTNVINSNTEDNTCILEDVVETAVPSGSRSSETAKLKQKPGPKTFKEKLQKKYRELTSKRQTVEESNSILLSDEDEPTPSVAERPSSVVPAKQPKDDEVIPLPLSLLSNENFIKIVAHTYSDGNPMLDADAATLAAQYSTFKSLKEAQETGKDIVSGPIYDIAVKVIGKHVFKQMNNVGAIASTVNVALQLKAKMRLIENQSKQKPNTETKANKLAKNCAMVDLIEIDDNEQTPQTSRTKRGVVPVGIVSASINNGTSPFSSSECILPDDDVHIVPHDMAAAPPSLAPRPDPTPSKNNITANTSSKTQPTLPKLKRKPQTTADTKPAPSSTPTQQTQNVKGSKRKSSALTTATSGASPQPPKAPTTAHDPATICLDSDDEENIVSGTATVIPVTIVSASNFITEDSSSTTKPSSPSTTTSVTSSVGTPEKPIVLRHVGVGPAPKFVLLPSGNTEAKIPLKFTPKGTSGFVKSAPEESAPTTSVKAKPTYLSLKIIAPTQSTQEKTTTPTPTLPDGITIKQTRCKPVEVKINDVVKSKTSRQVTPRTSISSSSSDSRPSSPVDSNPLSILKNVVHIQAADDAKSGSKQDTPSKSNSTNVNKNAGKSTAKVVPSKPAVLQKKDALLKQLIDAKSKDFWSESSAKSMQDLINKKSLSLKASKASGSKPGPFRGELKTIIVDKKPSTSTSKSITTVDLTDLPTVMAGSGTTMLNTRIEAKKRTSLVKETPPPKKKKTAPMTLKDFDLDDIDDIIELD
ncbi:uncharacterized protein LOC142980064 isoform X2 [Anticarsia gemmatalis]|uniref:uncharacterized protein LOC142980064 isoform X2 n=1 Tax=Anticarsia gemmatalis TaxID=129554 RepID=UPI003F776575